MVREMLSSPRGFGHVETWVFDLDNTLYPHHVNLWQQVDARIGEFVSDFLKVSAEEARRIQKDYYRRYGTTMLGPHGVECRFAAQLAAPEEEIGMFLYLTLLRIAKEALTNVVKHAGASHVELAMEVTPDCCRLSVADDGCGLSEARRDGRGLRNMRSRAAELHGKLSVASPPGTRLTLVVPLPYSYPVDDEGTGGTP